MKTYTKKNAPVSFDILEKVYLSNGGDSPKNFEESSVSSLFKNKAIRQNVLMKNKSEIPIDFKSHQKNDSSNTNLGIISAKQALRKLYNVDSEKSKSTRVLNMNTNSFENPCHFNIHCAINSNKEKELQMIAATSSTTFKHYLNKSNFSRRTVSKTPLRTNQNSSLNCNQTVNLNRAKTRLKSKSIVYDNNPKHKVTGIKRVGVCSQFLDSKSQSPGRKIHDNFVNYDMYTKELASPYQTSYNQDFMNQSDSILRRCGVENYGTKVLKRATPKSICRIIKASRVKDTLNSHVTISTSPYNSCQYKKYDSNNKENYNISNRNTRESYITNNDFVLRPIKQKIVQENKGQSNKKTISQRSVKNDQNLEIKIDEIALSSNLQNNFTKSLIHFTQNKNDTKKKSPNNLAIKTCTDLNIHKSLDQNHLTLENSNPLLRNLENSSMTNTTTHKLWNSSAETQINKPNQNKQVLDNILESDVCTEELQRKSCQHFEKNVNSNLQKMSAEFFSPKPGYFKVKFDEKKLELKNNLLECDVTYEMTQNGENTRIDLENSDPSGITVLRNKAPESPDAKTCSITLYQASNKKKGSNLIERNLKSSKKSMLFIDPKNFSYKDSLTYSLEKDNSKPEALNSQDVIKKDNTNAELFQKTIDSMKKELKEKNTIIVTLQKSIDTFDKQVNFLNSENSTLKINLEKKCGELKDLTHRVGEYSVIHNDLKDCNEHLIKDIDGLRNQFDIKVGNSIDTEKSCGRFVDKFRGEGNTNFENIFLDEINAKLEKFEEMNSKYFISLSNLVTQNETSNYIKEINSLLGTNQKIKLENLALKNDLTAIIEQLKHTKIEPEQKSKNFLEIEEINKILKIQNDEFQKEQQNLIYMYEEATEKNNYLDKIIKELSQELDKYKTAYERENASNSEIIQELNNKFESQKNASDKQLNYNIQFFDTNNKQESKNIQLEDDAKFYKQQGTEISNELHIFQLENQYIRKNNDELLECNKKLETELEQCKLNFNMHEEIYHKLKEEKIESNFDTKIYTDEIENLMAVINELKLEKRTIQDNTSKAWKMVEQEKRNANDQKNIIKEMSKNKQNNLVRQSFDLKESKEFFKSTDLESTKRNQFFNDMLKMGDNN